MLSFPGKECNSPASMALQRVDIFGKKRVARKKSMRALRCGSVHKSLARWDGACADDKLIVACGSAACEKLFILSASLYRAFEDVVSSAIQRWLLAVCVPLSTSLPFFVMVQVVLLKYSSQSSSHSFPTEKRGPDAKYKKMWASRTFLEM